MGLARNTKSKIFMEVGMIIFCLPGLYRLVDICLLDYINRLMIVIENKYGAGQTFKMRKPYEKK